MRYLFFTILFFPIGQLVAQTDIYNTSWKKDGTVIGISTAALAAEFIFGDQNNIFSAEEINALDRNDVWSFDRSAIGNFSSSAADVSDILKNGVTFAPLAFLLSNQGRKEYKDIGVMYGEAMVITAALTSFTKNITGRSRPYMYDATVDLEFKQSRTARRSFFSGHTSHVSMVSFFSASVFDDLYPDSRYKYAVWAAAMSLPALTAYTRYKAGRHFPTDVIVGYGVGALVGYFIPKLHKREAFKNVSLYGEGDQLGFVWTF